MVGYLVVCGMYVYLLYRIRKLTKKKPKLRPNEFLWRMDVPEGFEGRCYIHHDRYYCSLINGRRLHREDGPALEFDDGGECWYHENQLHRVDGPAVIDNRGNQTYWIHGWQFDEEMYWKLSVVTKHPKNMLKKLNKILEMP